jgi:hypothetical protein
MAKIYNALGEIQKTNLCTEQKNTILNTIENSGDGKSEETPICVIRAGDVISQLDRFSFFDRSQFEQKSKTLPNESVLTYKMGNEVYYILLVGGFNF